MGSWVWYGLGSEADDLPGFVVLTQHGRGRAAAADRLAAVAQRVSAEQVPGRPVPVQGRPGALPAATRRASRREQQRDVIDAVEKLNRIDRRRRGRPGNRHAHQPVRDGVQDADERARADGPHGRAASRRSSCTAPRAADGSFAANCLLARRLAERGVRFIQLYHRDWDHHGDLKNDIKLMAEEVDQAVGGAAQGSEAARHARRHAGHLGRRVRPHADGPGQRPRPPHQGLLHLDGRRRHQGRHHPRRDRRTGLQRRSRTSSTSTTCTRRCCTCWASTTSS